MPRAKKDPRAKVRLDGVEVSAWLVDVVLAESKRSGQPAHSIVNGVLVSWARERGYAPAGERREGVVGFPARGPMRTFSTPRRR